MDFTGYLTINGADAWTEYGAFLGETEAGGHVNMDALLRLPKAKDLTTVDFRERNGVELPQNPNVKWSSIERTLQFWLCGSTESDRLDKYQRLLKALTTGVVQLAVKDYRTFQMVYRDMPSDPKWYKSFEGNRWYVLFSVKMMEAQPSV